LGVASWYFAFSGFQIAKAPQVYPELFRPIGIGVLAFGGLGCITVCYMALLDIIGNKFM